MGLSYALWGLLLKKNIIKAKNGDRLSKAELFYIGLTIAGWLLRMWCKHIMGKMFTYQITVYKDHEIMDKGPYSLVRHPGYTGILSNWMGICLWTNHWWGWCLYALLFRDTYCNAISEEKEFEKNIPAYSQYKKRVPARFFPFIL